MPYEALSYEWQTDENETRNIKLDDYYTHIRKNIYDALSYIRLSSDSRMIWVDALCIDQQNDHVRNQQVQKMGQIHSSAERVLVRLGLAADSSDIAMDIISKVDDLSVKDMRSKPRNVTTQNIAALEFIEKLQVAQFEALRSLYSRPYWYCIWIRQELHLDQQLLVYCCNKLVTDDAISSCLLADRQLRQQLETEAPAILFQITHQVGWGIVSRLLAIKRSPARLLTLKSINRVLCRLGNCRF